MPQLTFSEVVDNGKWVCTLEEATELLGRKPCCRYDMGGSHYHCGNCGGASGMQGHYGRIPGHDWTFNCPDNPRIAPWESESQAKLTVKELRAKLATVPDDWSVHAYAERRELYPEPRTIVIFRSLDGKAEFQIEVDPS